MDYKLENGEELNKEHPNTFHIPARTDREDIPVGTFVKLIFRYKDSKAVPERMWVKITNKTENGYIGKLDNTPHFSNKLKYGDEVMFSPEHIISIYEKP